MKMFKAAAAAMAGAAALACAGAASATTIVSYFTVDGSSSPGLGVGSPYGEVDVNDAGGTLAFTVTLFDNLRFRDAQDSNHHSFGFNLNGIAATIGSITDNGTGTFSVQPGPFNQSPFGNFAYGVECNTCTTGYSSNSPYSLSFVVTKTGGGSLTVDDLTKSTGGEYFSADVASPIVRDDSHPTGNIGATTFTSAVPEPASWLLMMAGFGGLGAVLRRRRETGLVAA
jgi:hypothetical protein